MAVNHARQLQRDEGFSPLREGDTSVAPEYAGYKEAHFPFQSPSRGGHLRGALETLADCCAIVCFSPLREGDTSVARRRSVPGVPPIRFQSPSRGGHLRGAAADDNTEGPILVSVPFARGTPPWRPHERS